MAFLGDLDLVRNRESPTIGYLWEDILVKTGLSSLLAIQKSIAMVDLLDRQSLDNRFQTPIFFSTIVIVSLDIQSIFGPQNHYSQSAIISSIAIDSFNHQSVISITAIDIFHHQAINSTIAIDFWITSRELIPLLTDMTSLKRLNIPLLFTF